MYVVAPSLYSGHTLFFFSKTNADICLCSDSTFDSPSSPTAALYRNTSTQKDFLYDLGDDDHKYLSIFTLLTPVSVLGAPFVDYLILNFGWTVALQSINMLAVSFLSIKVFSTDLNVQIIGFLLFSFYRSFLFGVSFSFLPSLIAGPVVGRAGGIMTASAGVVGLLLIPLIQLVVGNDKVDFFIPNIVILSLCVPTTIVICLLGRFIRLENDYKLVLGADGDGNANGNSNSNSNSIV